MENNSESREMTQEELDRILGGCIPTQLLLQQQRVPDMQCPRCESPIPVSLEQLLSGRALRCSICGFTLNIDKSRSDKALEILAKIEEEQRRLTQ